MKSVFAGVGVGVTVLLCCISTTASPVALHFRVSAQGTSGAVMPDVFRAVGSESPSVLKAYDSSDLLKPPGPPAGDYIQAKTVVSGLDLIADYRPYDPNAADVNFAIELFAHDDEAAGIDGTMRLELTEADQLDDIDADTMVYLARYDASGVFEEQYDLRDTSNHAIELPLQAAQGHFATVNLVVINKCVAANLDGSGLVNIGDMAKLASSWNEATTDGDIDGNHEVNILDLIIMADYWLCECGRQ
jgi:hypothetical protein